MSSMPEMETPDQDLSSLRHEHVAVSRVRSHILGAGARGAVSQGTRGEDVDWQMD